ncbi:hypothetical protein Tco_0446617 [Tanacetum coccineum]
MAYIMAAYEVPTHQPGYHYVPGPEEPEQAPPSPGYLPYVPEPVYLEYIPPADDVFLAEEQPLHDAASPTAKSPGYIPESDPEEDPEEDPADYPADRDDDDDDDEDEDEDEEEEEKHPAPADSVPPIHRMTARISIRDEPSISLPPREEIPSTPPDSPTHIEIPKSCLPLWKRVRFASPTPSQEVGESSAAGAARQDRPTLAREDLYGFVDMVDIPPRCSTSRELDYGITDTWDDLVGAIDEIAPTTLEGVNQRITNFSTVVEQEPTIMYGVMEDARDRSLITRRDQLRLCTFRCYVITYYGSGVECIDFRGYSQQIQGGQRVITEQLRPAGRELMHQEWLVELPRLVLWCSYAMQNVKYYLPCVITAANWLHVMHSNMADDSLTSGIRVPEGYVQVARECTYSGLPKMQPRTSRHEGDLTNPSPYLRDAKIHRILRMLQGNGFGEAVLMQKEKKVNS